MVAALIGEISPDCTNRFCSQLDELSITTLDPFDIDFILATHLRTITPPSVYAVAITIHIPNAIHPCGGLVGNPHQTIESAEPSGMAARVAPGLSVAAYPGGPGVLVQGSPQLAHDALQQASPQSCTVAELGCIVDYASTHGAPLVVVTSDGSGRGMQGHILARSQGLSTQGCIPLSR